MDIVTYALCKKLVASATSGVTWEVDGLTLKITTSDGQQLEMTFPQPKDGVSITNMEINEQNHLICSMSDKSTIDCGEIKTLRGESGVYIGTEEPSDPDIKVWINPEENDDTYGKHEIDNKLDTKVDRVTVGKNGRSEFQNMEDGDQILFLTEDGKRANVSVNDGSHGVYVQLGAMDKETNKGVRVSLGLDKAYYTVGDTPDVTDDDEIITKHALEYETQDLIKGLSRHLLEEDEDPEASGQTVVELKNRQDATETIMEIDNMDVKTSVPVNAVLGALKGHDLDERVNKLEAKSLITISAEMSKDDRTNHTYPKLTLSPEQINTIVDNDATLLKVNFNITDASNGIETDTLVFYTTIDDNKVVDGDNIVRTVKINAVRTNYEGTIIYHAELLGNGEVFAANQDLTAKYVPFSTE